MSLLPVPLVESTDAGAASRAGAPVVARHAVGLSSTGVFLISLAIQGIGFAASFFLYHQVGANNPGKALLGTVQLYLIIASSINGIGDLRIGTAYVYYVARGRPPAAVTGTYLGLRLAMVGAAGVTLFVIGSVPHTGFTWSSNFEEYSTLAVFMGLPILWSIQTVFTQLTVAQGQSTRGQLPLFLESIVRTPLLIAAAFLMPTLEGLTLAYAAGAVASTIYSLPSVLRQSRTFSWSEARGLFQYAWPLMGSLVLMYLANNTPPFIVNAYVGLIGLTIFSAANAWRILALSLPAAVAVPLFPHLSGLHRLREYESVRVGTWKALRYTAMIVVPVVVAMVVYRVNLLNIFANASFATQMDAPKALAILAASVIPASLSQIVGTSLNAIGRQRLELYLTSLQVVVLFAASVLLLKPFFLFGLGGLVAVSIAILASSAAALVLNTYFMERLLAVRIQYRSIGSILLSAAAAFFAVSRLNSVIAVNRWYELAPAVLLGFFVYFLVMAAVGELSREDVRYLGASIGFPKRATEALARLCWRHDSPAVNTAGPGEAEGLTVPLEELSPEDRALLEVGGRLP